MKINIETGKMAGIVNKIELLAHTDSVGVVDKEDEEGTRRRTRKKKFFFSRVDFSLVVLWNGRKWVEILSEMRVF